MFCPQCGINQSEELKFCNKCGANLYAVRQVVTTRETNDKFDWNKTWVTEMFLSQSERKRREEELEIQRGITPEVKRYKEIKAGVITSCVGIGAMIFLYVLMQGIILSGKVDANDAEILRRVWVAGVIPFMVGVGLMINGLLVSKKLIEIMRQDQRTKALMTSGALGNNTKPFSLESGDSTEFVPPDFSVTEEATKRLKNFEQKR
ncbi:MAG: hypothetical protein ABI954_12030 [Pyrinomonadaceae bacterium]